MPLLDRRALVCGLLFAASQIAQAAPPDEPILGPAPTYTSRKPGTIPDQPFPNAGAMVRRIWAPGLDEGYVPQGLTFSGGAIYLGSYRSTDTAQGRGPCRLWRIDALSGGVTGSLDLPPACGHAGGLARGAPGRIWVVDTRVMFEVALAPQASGSAGKVLRQVGIEPPLKGSFAAGDGSALWIGTYERSKAARLFRVPLSAITGASIGLETADRIIPIPSRAQGAALDGKGRLWLTRSSATLGELLRLDAATGEIKATYRVPDGIEDLSFDAAGRLWTVSEAGSRRWQGWATHFPVVFQLDPARLR